jgi:methionine-rich copper-binding protein CopC
MTPLFSRALCGIALAGVAAGTAIAATPDSGTVNEATPKVEWTGETTGGYLTRMPTAVSGSTDTPCEAPSCDTFALKVKKSANLTIAESLDSDSESAAFTLRIVKPDGEVVQTDSDPGAAANKYVKVVIKNAPTGDYTIEHFDNAADGNSFKAYAELAVAAAKPVVPPVVGETPAPPVTVQALDLGVTVGKLSAKKLAKSKKLAAKVTVSRAVTGITAALKSGAKVVGKGSLGATSGTKTLSLKLAKKLKKGSYSLSVVATDGTTTTEKVIKVKVAK